MDWSDFFTAFSLYLVLEGLLPFVSPGNWRKGLSVIAQLNDGQIRFFGIILMVAGMILLVMVRGAVDG